MERYNKMFEDSRINVKQKLSALWAALMFVYVYVDIFSFYKPGAIEDILVGKVWKFDITQTWALSGLILMLIPTLMIFLALALPSKANRWVNLIVAPLYIAVSIGNAVGESWAFVILGSVVESVLLALIVWYAWKWPKQNKI